MERALFAGRSLDAFRHMLYLVMLEVGLIINSFLAYSQIVHLYLVMLEVSAVSVCVWVDLFGDLQSEVTRGG